ncbi:glycosyltransferase family 4 protein [Roseovarius sp.]|uniref:glycosyltransferase family 4 protein n=1 Tax=Roseovarius sp. TaxID=1486281 RepID=UPI003565E4FD
MKVANVIEEGKLGGPQVRMVRVAAALGDQAETLIVMPRANSGPFREMCATHGVPYRALPLTRITKEWRAALAYVLFSPWEVMRLARLFRRERIDLVHASGGSWQYKAVIAARLAGIPSVWHLNDTSTPGWVRRLFRLVQPLASGFIFASQRSQEYYGELVTPGRPQAVVPSTVDTAHFDPERDLPRDQDVPRGGPVIGAVANVNPVKGLETLIRAAARLREMGHTPHVVIVGPVFSRQTEYHRRLVALAQDLGLDRVHFVGARVDVRPLLARFDAYVCSSVAESSPVSVWEAMAMARPIVSTDVGDVARHVLDGEAGFVVPVDDDTAMAERLARLLDDSALRDRMGRAARQAVSAFSPDRVAKATLDFYQQVLPIRNHEVKHRLDGSR